LLKGTIEASNGGIIKLPAPSTANDATRGKVTQIGYAGGGIRLNAGSKAYLKDSDGGSPRLYFGLSSDGAPQYEWSAADNTSYVELTNDSLSLTGKLKVAKASYFNNNAAIKQESELTVANTLTLGEAGKLEVASGAKIVVSGASGVLDLSALFDPPTGAGAATPGGGTSHGKVALAGDIVVEKDGILNISQGNGSALPPEIDWTKGGSLIVKHSGKVTLNGTVTYIGGTSAASGTIYFWTDSTDTSVSPAFQNVTLNDADGITMNANITVSAIPCQSTNIISGKNKITATYTLELDKTSSTTNNEMLLKVRDGSELIVEGTLKLDAHEYLHILPTAKLTVAQSGTIEAGEDVTVKFGVYKYFTPDMVWTATRATTTPTSGNNRKVATVGDSISAPQFEITLGKVKITSVADTSVNVDLGNASTAAQGSIEADDDTVLLFTGVGT
jgi:hypothetical protein